MTQLVFVHGVATRSGSAYDQTVENRDKLFRAALFQGGDVSIHTPLWGDLVPAIAGAVFDTKGVTAYALGAGSQPFGGGMGGINRTGAAGAAQSGSFATIAKANPTVALDALFAELLDRYDAEGVEIPEQQLGAFMRAVDAMAADEAAGDNLELANNGAKALLAGVASDADLGAALGAGADPVSYGIVNAFSQAAKSVADRLRKAVSSVALDPLADFVRPAVGMFLGDVFTYLHDGETRTAVRAKIREAFEAAQHARKPGEKLVVIGHSLGGVILVDMLYSPESAGLPAGLKVDALLTVGSQPGLFQALGLFRPASEEAIGKPEAVAHWFNVFDPIDPLAFRADPIFTGVEDFQFNSITGLASAHTTYFKRPQFYARSRKRLIDAGVI